jgi:hypothetical protein
MDLFWSSRPLRGVLPSSNAPNTSLELSKLSSLIYAMFVLLFLRNVATLTDEDLYIAPT